MTDKAITARRQIHGEMGGATVFMVRLPDGFLLDCGTDMYAEVRSKLIVNMINAAGPEGLGADTMQDELNRHYSPF